MTDKRSTQVGVELIFDVIPNMVATQLGVELLERVPHPLLCVTQVGVEILEFIPSGGWDYTLFFARPM